MDELGSYKAAFCGDVEGKKVAGSLKEERMEKRSLQQGEEVIILGL